MGDADFVIKVTYVVMLGIIGVYMFVEALQSLRRKPVESKRTVTDPPRSPSITAWFNLCPTR